MLSLMFPLTILLLFQLFDLGPDGGENESFGDLLAETEEIPFECGARYVWLCFVLIR
jgi:hypothetical protein